MVKEKNIPDLFSASAENSYKMSKWHLVTNHLNIFYMLGAGLIMSPKGYGRKYYNDQLSIFPGWIPLFANDIPKSAIEPSASESKLLTCIATIKLSSLAGPLKAIDEKGNVSDFQFPNELKGTEKVLLVPAPLPSSWIETIAFQSGDDKIKFDKEVSNYSNVSLHGINLEVVPDLFSGVEKVWPPSEVNLTPRDKAPSKALAVGGIMTTLLHLGNIGNLGIQASHMAFEPEKTNLSKISESIIRELDDWIISGEISKEDDKVSKLFWGAVDSVINSSSLSENIAPREAVLEYMSQASNDFDEKEKKVLTKLTEDLQSLTGAANFTNTEIFKRHTKSFSRAIILFFLKQKSDELIEYQHELLSEEDYINAAVLVGARDAWINMSLKMRDIEGLQKAVSHRMAALEHRISDSKLDLGASPNWPAPIRELFSLVGKEWTEKQKEAAMILARESQGLDCIKSEISLGKGDYQISVNNKRGENETIVNIGDCQIIINNQGGKITKNGEANINVMVDSEEFFKKIGRAKIPAKTEQKVRNIFKA